MLSFGINNLNEWIIQGGLKSIHLEMILCDYTSYLEAQFKVPYDYNVVKVVKIKEYTL